MKNLLVVLILFIETVCFAKDPQNIIENEYIITKFTNTSDALFSYQLKNGKAWYNIAPPIFEINGAKVSGLLKNVVVKKNQIRSNGVAAYSISGSLISNPALKMHITFRLAAKSSILRFRYTLSSDRDQLMTKEGATDNLLYFTYHTAAKSVNTTEICFSDYNKKNHSYVLTEQSINESFFKNEISIMGPMLVSEYKKINESSFIAYEHGSQFPDSFVEFSLQKNSRITIKAKKGNYSNKQIINADNPYETIWLQTGVVKGDKEMLAQHYRSFALNYLSENLESRKPYLYYNTWGRQERGVWAGGKYLQRMNLSHTLKEIDRAKDMGLEVFVIDAGWFMKTGDWQVNTDPKFFPDTLNQVIKKIKQNGMKLGLWFNPVVAGKTSNMLQRNLNAVSTRNGKQKQSFPIWETEESHSICLVSSYWKDYTAEMLKLISNLEISYVKWDAVDQYACNDPNHFHGNTDNTPQERSDRHAFLLPLYLSKVVEQVNAKFPKVIFDFDITEDGRCMGLSFLSSGKYFAINNGPYYHNFDLAETWESPLANKNANILVHPGPARPWFMRSVLSYDKWLPSTLFLTHYQTDGLRNSQQINIASLILGQNGIWGEILNVKEEDVSYISSELTRYKQVRNDITLATPVTTGNPGEVFEVHEKINENGKGVIVVFGNGNGKCTYISKNKVSNLFINSKSSKIKIDSEGRAVVEVEFTEPNAEIIWFGVN